MQHVWEGLHRIKVGFWVPHFSWFILTMPVLFLDVLLHFVPLFGPFWTSSSGCKNPIIQPRFLYMFVTTLHRQHFHASFGCSVLPLNYVLPMYLPSTYLHNIHIQWTESSGNPFIICIYFSCAPITLAAHRAFLQNSNVDLCSFLTSSPLHSIASTLKFFQFPLLADPKVSMTLHKLAGTER